MKVNINNTLLRIESIPDSFLGLAPNPLFDSENPEEFPELIEQNILNYQSRTDLHHSHGWRDVVTPEFNRETERLGELYFDLSNDVVTYEVLTISQEEIKNNILQQAESERETFVQNHMRKMIDSQLQDLIDEEAVLQKSSFPIFQSGIEVKAGKKYQALNSDNVLKLYKSLNDFMAESQPKDDLENWIQL